MDRTSKHIAASVVSTLIAVSMIQTATAGERTRRNHVAASEQVRNAKAAVAPFQVDQDEIARYRNGAGSALAGR